jgi:hypothetical protein
MKLDYSVTVVAITCQGKNGKQYVAVVAASGRGASAAGNETLAVFALF